MKIWTLKAMKCLQKCDYKNKDNNFRNVSWQEGNFTIKSDKALKGIPEEDFKNASKQGVRWRKELEHILRGQSVDFAAFQW